jgi:hypothetical protein
LFFDKLRSVESLVLRPRITCERIGICLQFTELQYDGLLNPSGDLPG